MLKLLMGMICLSACAYASAALPPPQAPQGAVTSIVLENTGPAQRMVPLSFGQVFAPGDVGADDGLAGKLDDGTPLALQLDVKARHPDGSLRHAIISAIVPALAPNQQLRLTLVKAAPATPAPAPGPAALLKQDFHAAVSVTIDGHLYKASADALLREGKITSWLSGPIAQEWLLAAPLSDANGKPHPHLAARFAIRAYGGRARVDVSVDNDWAYEPGPQNFTYNARITVGGKTVWEQADLTHFHHARWRQVAWWGEAPQVHLRHDSAYLIASRALPNYDQQVDISEATLAGYQRDWSGAKTAPMGVGLANPYMPTTGGRPDLGLLPGWGASYLLSMDRRAKEVTLKTADLAGSWSAHYRDRATGRPISLADYPYMTILGQRADTLNPATKKLEAFPPCATPTACNTPNKHDAAHQPAFAYLPYLVTGDYYYLEELQFWAMWNSFSHNPAYREAGRGLVKADQVRGQAWSLRTLGEAAYITPDADPLKADLRHILDANLDWYNSNYSANPQTNRLGILTHGYALGYEEATGMAPWMDDFFTSAIGHVAELGFPKAKTLLDWKITFPIARIQGDGACWITAAPYGLKVRDNARAPIYTTISQVWTASNSAGVAQLPCGGPEMATTLKLKIGEMSGYSSSTTGYPSILQAALAYAADTGGAGGAAAWSTFTARTVKPNYGTGAQFAIVPRLPIEHH